MKRFTQECRKMETTEDEEIEKYVNKFIEKKINAINISEYVEQIITHMRQEQLFSISSNNFRLKRIVREIIDKLISQGILNKERFMHISNKPYKNDCKKRKMNIVNKKSLNIPEVECNKSEFIIPEMKLSDLALSENIVEMIERIIFYVKNRKVFKDMSLKPCIGAIINGLPGSGKTSLVNAICGTYNIPLYTVSAIELLGNLKVSTEEKITLLFRKLEHSSGILFIDDLDDLMSDLDSSSYYKQEERNIINKLNNCLDKLEKYENCFVFASTSNLAAIDSSLRRVGRLEHELSISMPDEKMREKILNILTRNIKLNENVNLKEIARFTPGYVANDLCALIRDSFYSTLNKINKDNILITDNCIEISHSDVMNSIKNIQPSSTKNGFCSTFNVNLSDVGGLQSIKQHLSIVINGCILHPEIFKNLGIKSSTGILLVGPPGCGKTLIAKAIAQNDGLNFISIRGPELLNSYVGETERAIRGLFSKAQIAEPCVIFFDEIDSICPKRSSDSNNNYSARLVNQLLTEIDNILQNNRILIIGATNRPDIIDKALLRKGRFDRIFYVDIPSPNDRISIIQSITKNYTCPYLSPDIDIHSLAYDERLNNFSGADLSSLIRESSLLAYQQFIQNHSQIPIITIEHIHQALNYTKASLNDQDLLYYNQLKRQYDN